MPESLDQTSHPIIKLVSAYTISLIGLGVPVGIGTNRKIAIKLFCCLEINASMYLIIFVDLFGKKQVRILVKNFYIFKLH